LDPVLKFPFIFQSDCNEALNECHSRCDMADSSSLKLSEVFKSIMNTNRGLLYEADVIWNTYNTLLDPVLKIHFIFQSVCHEALNECHSRCDIADSSSLKLLEVFNNIMNTDRGLLYEADVIWNTSNTLLDPVLKFHFIFQSDCHEALNEFLSRCDIADSSSLKLLEVFSNIMNTNRKL